MMRRLVLGTAGHIDHGKTTLVRALTGIDTDRLPEEKRRGITIDLGFASLALDDEVSLGIVDVPGHEAFVRNMLAGATGIDMFLLVVAADEGVMPQTREHLAILNLLGIRRGIVALTKADLVDPEWLELVQQEASELLGDSGLSDVAVLGVSARSGSGVSELVNALRILAHEVERDTEDDLFRMPVDRVFTVRGTGTVVTGTVWSESLRRDQQVRLLPSGVTARVRSLQQHGTACDEVAAGARAAIALTGVDREAVERGETAVSGEGWSAAGILTVELRLLPDAGAALRPRQRVRVHVGTTEVLGRVGLLREAIAPGESAIAQLRLESPVLARAGDRIVIRSYSPVHTIGGAICLEPAAPKRKRIDTAIAASLETLARELSRDHATSSDPDAHSILRAVVDLGPPHGVDPAMMPVLTGLRPATAAAALRTDESLVLAGNRILSAARLRSVGDEVLRHVTAAHRADPLADGLERERLRRDVASPLLDVAVDALLAAGSLAAVGNALALPDHTPTPDDDARAAFLVLEQLYAAAGLQAPEVTELSAPLTGRTDLLTLHRYLERNGVLVRLTQTRWMEARALAECVTALRGQLPAGTPLTVADIKDVVKLTRKHLIPLLEHLDRSGVTQRSGEMRILAPDS